MPTPKVPVRRTPLEGLLSKGISQGVLWTFGLEGILWIGMNRTYEQLTDTQRYQIEAWIIRRILRRSLLGSPMDLWAFRKAGMPKKFIIAQLEINRSTLYRELKRNSSKTGIYSKGVLWTGLKKHNLYVMNARNVSVEYGSSQKRRKRR